MTGSTCPPHLRGYEDIYRESPIEASRRWFDEAGFGLFMHYGVYSLLGRGEWVMFNERIPVKEYERLKDRFTAERFDAEAITDLALEAGMKYVNITSRHHDSFCLFRTDQTDFNSVQSPAGRDLVAELAEAIRSLQPHCLISFKQGANGEEDFAAPERSAHSLEERVAKQFGPHSAEIARRAWEKNSRKKIEICATLQSKGWGYHAEANHKGPDEVMRMIENARGIEANLLLNTGPLGDGSIHPQDERTLREIGQTLYATPADYPSG